MPTRVTLDDIDRRILALLGEDARRTIADIARRVNLSAAPVKRRIERLEREKVIVGYSLAVDESRLEASIEAFLEMRFAGDADVGAISAQLQAPKEVVEVMTVAGDPDALLRIRVDDVQHLKRVIVALRKIESVSGTKALMILDRWTRARF